MGILYRIPTEEWVTGRPMASVVMAAFCHPRPGGGRFNAPDRGAWYAGTALATAHAEVVYHRTEELAEVGVLETRLQMRLYLANFEGAFHDVRADIPQNVPFHDPVSYQSSQALARELLAAAPTVCCTEVCGTAAGNASRVFDRLWWDLFARRVISSTVGKAGLRRAFVSCSAIALHQKATARPLNIGIHLLFGLLTRNTHIFQFFC